MDKAQTMKWIVAALTRGIAFALAGWLGMSASTSQSTGGMIANAIGGLVLAGISIYTSTKGRKKILATKPPRKKA